VIESRKGSRIGVWGGGEREGKREEDRMQRAEASRLGKKAETPSAARY